MAIQHWPNSSGIDIKIELVAYYCSEAYIATPILIDLAGSGYWLMLINNLQSIKSLMNNKYLQLSLA